MALPALALPFMIRVAVVQGIATAIELDSRRHLHRDCRALHLSAIRLALTVSDADRDRVAIGRHPVDHRNCDRDGLGADPIWCLASACHDDGTDAGRTNWISGSDDPDVRCVGERTRGLFAPPFGVGFYAACAIGRVSPDDAMGRVWPYLGAVLVALVLIALFPWLSIGFL